MTIECDAIAVKVSGLARQLCILQIYPLPLGPTDPWTHMLLQTELISLRPDGPHCHGEKF